MKSIIGKSSYRKSRLHDEKGNLISLKYIFSHMIPALISYIISQFGFRPILPWIPYSAINFLNKIPNKENLCVLEYGSGMSTIWFANNFKNIYSVEDYKPWHSKVLTLINKLRIINIDYNYISTKEDYINFCSKFNILFDLIIIDGSYRSECIKASLKYLRPGGYLYLDDSDKNSINSNETDMRICENILRSLSPNDGCVFEFTDFSPCQFFVKQGMVYIKPKQI
jgi:hypothetical protein